MIRHLDVGRRKGKTTRGDIHRQLMSEHAEPGRRPASAGEQGGIRTEGATLRGVIGRNPRHIAGDSERIWSAQLHGTIASRVLCEAGVSAT